MNEKQMMLAVLVGLSLMTATDTLVFHDQISAALDLFTMCILWQLYKGYDGFGLK